MARSIPILRYRHVSPDGGPLTVSPSRFDAQMSMLANEGWKTINTSALLNAIGGQAEIPEKACLITFDGGFLDNYVYAWPLLTRYHLNATLFLVTGWIGNGNPRLSDPAVLSDRVDHLSCLAAIDAGQQDDVMLRWSEIQRMRTAGNMEIHSGGHRPLHWDRENESHDTHLARVVEELTQSRGLILRHTGEVERQIGWTGSGFDGNADLGYREAARKAGFFVHYTAEPGPNLRGDDPTRIRRFNVEDEPAGWLASRLKSYRSSLRGTWRARIREA
ncbi:MAG: polysaccharide deacetylase family protein [Gammaproteobacteria bacterium]|nr:polysaccharide deacetylase family protein [Gammaproteobacteria bacterium]MCP5136283.1 polysaccharide deacetylase family protein [Gammaproteobacteria bacterium]